MGRGADEGRDVVLTAAEYDTVRRALHHSAGVLADVAAMMPDGSPVRASAHILSVLVGEAGDVLRAARRRAEAGVR